MSYQGPPKPPRKALIKLLRGGRSSDWEQAANLVCDFEAEQRVLWLPELFEDKDHEVRELAIELAIERINDDFALLDALLALLDEQPHTGCVQAVLLTLRAFEATPGDEDAAAFAQDIDRLLIKLSREANGDVRYQALAAREFREHEGPAYRAHLIEALDDPDEDCLIIAAQGLARLGAVEARSALLDVMNHARGSEVRFQLLLSLAALQAEGLVPEFERALRRGPQRFATILALGDYGDPSATRILRKLVKGWFGDPLEKVAAARSLALLDDAEGLTRLRRFAEDRRPEVKGYSLEALVSLDDPGVSERLVDAIDSPDDPAAAVATSLLRKYRDPEHEDLLVDAARDHPREEVREAAAEVLARWRRADA